MELEKARNVSKKQTTPSFTTPVATEFFMIDASEEMNAKENAWSIENMPGHKAENRTTKYIGSHFEASWIWTQRISEDISTTLLIPQANIGMESG